MRIKRVTMDIDDGEDGRQKVVQFATGVQVVCWPKGPRALDLGPDRYAREILELARRAEENARQIIENTGWPEGAKV